MRLVSCTLFALALGTMAALAIGPGWNGPGWYVVMNTPVKNEALYRGAYRTKEDCMAAKPEDHGSVGFDCIDFDHEPLDQ